MSSWKKSNSVWGGKCQATKMFRPTFWMAMHCVYLCKNVKRRGSSSNMSRFGFKKYSNSILFRYMFQLILYFDGRLVTCDTIFGFWLTDGFYLDDCLQGFHRELTTYFERQYIYVQLLTSILMTRPTNTECNYRSRSSYLTRDRRALTVTEYIRRFHTCL